MSHQSPELSSPQHQGASQESASTEGKSLAPPQFKLTADPTPPDGGDQPTQLKAAGGMPTDLVQGFSNSTGHDLSNVNVHYNSSQPSQVGALAYAQGNDIHLGPGQEKHLAHEAGHIVQQRENRVTANTSIGGVAVNNDKGLESEADKLGEKAQASVQMKAAPGKVVEAAGSGAIQRVTDYDALAQQMYTELDEYFPDIDDVMAILQQLNSTDGFQRLSSAYNLVSPSEPLITALQDSLSAANYRTAMEAVAGFNVVTANDQVRANTAEAGYNLRAGASATATQIGQMNFTQMSVTVRGKGISGDKTFYKVHFNAADYATVTAGFDVATLAPDLASAREAWVTGDALNMYVSWDALIAQLQHFDIMTTDKTIQEKVTMLRQMAHASNLPFDQVIGTGTGSYYEDNRPNLTHFYQILKEGKAVQTPNGEIVDIYHFIVGLDAYQSGRRRDVTPVSQYGLTLNPDIGKSDAAATWAGDIGAAAADCMLAQSSEYEGHLRATSRSNESERIAYYYRSRAPMADLLGDIDAWGAYESVEDGSAVTITEVVRNYYGAQALGGGAFQAKRRRSLDLFFARYGLTARGGNYVSPANQLLLSEQIRKFALVWWQNRTGLSFIMSSTAQATQLGGYCWTMAGMFLDQIQALVVANR